MANPPNPIPTILITGASGMLGRALHRLLLLPEYASNYHVIGTGLSRLSVDHYHDYFSAPQNSSKAPTKTVKLHHLNLLDHSSTTTFLNQHHPDIIVHCAAERFPDAFETNLEESTKLNVDSTRHLAQECLRLSNQSGQSNGLNKSKKPYLIYLSTSYVFDGGVESKDFPPYHPTKSKANPLNSYGRSKWEGECAVREILNPETTTDSSCSGGGQGIIVRVPLLYGEDCMDLNESPALDIAKVLLPSNLSKDPPVQKQIDDWALRFPTNVEDVAKVLKLMIDQLVIVDGGAFPAGTYHIASPHPTTKYQLIQLQSKLLHISKETLDDLAVGNKDPPGGAPRPQCTQLDCEETWKALGMVGNEGNGGFEFVTLEGAMERALKGFSERFAVNEK